MCTRLRLLSRRTLLTAVASPGPCAPTPPGGHTRQDEGASWPPGGAGGHSPVCDLMASALGTLLRNPPSPLHAPRCQWATYGSPGPPLGGWARASGRLRAGSRGVGGDRWGGSLARSGICQVGGEQQVNTGAGRVSAGGPGWTTRGHPGHMDSCCWTESQCPEKVQAGVPGSHQSRGPKVVSAGPGLSRRVARDRPYQW